MKKHTPQKINSRKNIKVALVTDWLTNLGGAEVVLKNICEIFPKAPIFTTLANRKNIGNFFREKTIITSFLQYIPGLSRKHQYALPLLPTAIESLDVSDYDIIISCSSAVAKGIKTTPQQTHISYIHCPMRWVWEPTLDPRFQKFPKIFQPAIRVMLKLLKTWDMRTAHNPDYIIANSQTTFERIQKYYKINANKILFPPFDPPPLAEKISTLKINTPYFIGLGRMVPYKKFDLLIETFAQRSDSLVLVGEGPEMKHLKQLAKKKSAKNIQFTGRLNTEEKYQLLSRAKALVHPQKEDAGITQLEALNMGVPVIAFKAGGSLEIIKDGQNGIFFRAQTTESINQALDQFITKKWNKINIKNSVTIFSGDHFKKTFLSIIQNIK